MLDLKLIVSNIGKVRDYANVGHNELEVLRFYRMPDQVFRLRDVLIRHLNAGAGWYFEVDGELAGIRLREKRQPEQRINRQTCQKHPAQQRHRQPRTLQRPSNPVLVIIEELVKHPVETGIEALHPGVTRRRGGFDLILIFLIRLRDVSHSLQETRAE